MPASIGRRRQTATPTRFRPTDTVKLFHRCRQDYNTHEMVYNVFDINGNNNLENLCRPDQTWKVRLIEVEFQRLMFEVENV
jgi:hypothetical protein